MGGDYEWIELWTAEFILQRLLDNLIVAEWEALVTCEGFADNYISYHEPRVLLSICKSLEAYIPKTKSLEAYIPLAVFKSTIQGRDWLHKAAASR